MKHSRPTGVSATEPLGGSTGIGPAHPAHRSALLALFEDVNAATAGQHMPVVTTGIETVAEWFDRKRPDRAWVYAQHGVLAGYVAATRYRGAHPLWGDLPDAEWELNRMAVHPRWWGLGIAGRLVEQVTETLPTVWATCHRGGRLHGLFVRRGWREVRAVTWRDDPQPGVMLVAP